MPLSLNKNTNTERVKQMRHAKCQEEHQARANRIDAASKWLKRYPVFRDNRILAIGIHHQINDEYRKQRDRLPFGSRHVKQAVSNYVKRKGYMSRCDTSPRYNLDGALADK